MTDHPAICRVCSAYCGIMVEVEDGRPLRVRGDRSDPVSHGYTCGKGRALPAQHAHPGRLLHSQKRGADGVHRPIPSEQAMDEIAVRIASIVERHGPRSVAIYVGTHAGIHPTSGTFGVGWLLALGSRMVFTAATIDQPGKNIATALHGRWLAGPYLYDEADAWLIVGANPIVSGAGPTYSFDPVRHIRDTTRSGQRLIVIDPRHSEVAQLADVHLQSRPGEDPALLAAMLHVILREKRFDRAFVEQNARGLEALARAVEPFDPETAAQRAGVPADGIVRAARTLAAAQRGFAIAGTGPNMSGRGNLTEYLLLCLITVCGHWRRAGETLPNPGVLLPPATPKAQAVPPRRAWGYGERLRVRELGNAACGLPTAALADEILLKGAGQIRALVCIGGNPAVAWPDQAKTLEALRSLELCVTLDIQMSATARFADYVIAPKHSLEVPGFSLPVEAYEQSYLGRGYHEPYARYTPAVVDPPAGSDVIDEWEFFYGLAQRLGLQLRLFPVRAEVGALRARRDPIDIDMTRKPTTDEIFGLLATGSRVPIADVMQHPRGALFPSEPVVVAPGDADCDDRLDLGNETMLAELTAIRTGPAVHAEADDPFPFRLVSRRLPYVYNSSGHDLAVLRGKRPYNPAFIHPDDLSELGIQPGEVVKIVSDHGSILGVAEVESALRRGILSMTHCFGDAPERDSELFEIGSNTNRLISVERDHDPYSGIPRMSAVPVAIERFEGSLSDPLAHIEDDR